MNERRGSGTGPSPEPEPSESGLSALPFYSWSLPIRGDTSVSVLIKENYTCSFVLPPARY